MGNYKEFSSKTSKDLLGKDLKKGQVYLSQTISRRNSQPKMKNIDLSFKSASNSILVQRYQEEESKRETLGWLKHNMTFRRRMMDFRNQVQLWVFELCKEESKRDFDCMAKLVSDYEGLGDKGAIGWAMGRITTLSSTINQAEKKVNGVFEASQINDKRIMNFMLEKNNLTMDKF